MPYQTGKIGSISRLRESLKKGGGNSQYIKQVPANDIMSVRFLTEPDEWYGYYETYDTEIKRYYPLIEGVEKPEGARVSYRYLAVVLDIESDQVIPLKLPKDLANRLMMRYDRFDTLLDRDYELSRMGEGLDTTYDVTPGDKVTRNLEKYEIIDLDAVLTEAAAVVTGVSATTEAPASPRERAAKKVVSSSAPTKVADDEDYGEDDPFKTVGIKKAEVAEDADDGIDEDEDEPVTQSSSDSFEDDDDDDDYITEEDLRKMNLSDLKAFAAQYQIETDDLGKDEIIQQIFASAG